MDNTLSAPFDGLIRALAPSQRRLLAKDIAFELRSRQAKRIAEQKNPDGSKYTPRKVYKVRNRKPKKLKMFNKLRTMRFLRRQYNNNEANALFKKAVGIARTHQYGRTVNIGGGVRATYPVRELLGFSDNDIAMVEEKILNHLSEGFA
ncbi:MAG: phage virion morphogenesis protein [Gammaproteobacteria bacterium]|nr:MAG: phage virion morphogenesis protein [Gammaproteobacteria bacterium]